jgi:outer membrane lipoprotein-sorting protein
VKSSLLAAATLVALAFGAAIGAAPAAETDIRKYVCQKLDDFTAEIAVSKANQTELAKINKDIGLAYRFKSAKVSYKEPNQVRMEGAAEGSKITWVMNGVAQVVYINGKKVSERKYTDAPGKRKSLMDVGLVSEYYLTYTNAKFLREGSVDGTKCAVFEMRYDAKFDDTSHHTVYIDPATRCVLRREAYSQEGKLQAVYFYRDPKQIAPGVWFPSRVEAQNLDRVIAGVTEYRNIKVNSGLPESLFK